MAIPPSNMRQTVDETAYIAARRTLESKCGALRYRLPMLLLCAALTTGAVVTALQNPYSIGYLLTAIVLLVCAGVIAFVFCRLLPQRSKAHAKADYIVYDRLMNPATVTFAADEFTVKTPCLTRECSYAEMKRCIETADRFVLLADDQTMIVLEKACFAETERTVSFLRQVFTRVGR